MTERTCSVEGCNRPAWAKGMCLMHYRRQRKHGDPGGAESLRPRGGKTCSVEGCDRRGTIHGMCTSHDYRWQTYGTTDPLPPKVCSIEGCGAPFLARGWCQDHYYRWKKYGDPLAEKVGPGPKVTTHPLERFFQYAQIGHPLACWPWTGSLNQAGYGQLQVGTFEKPRVVRTHRFSYEFFIGPVPDGLVLDHICHTSLCVDPQPCAHRRCCNPWHLNPTTSAENVARTAGRPKTRRHASS